MFCYGNKTLLLFFFQCVPLLGKRGQRLLLG